MNYNMVFRIAGRISGMLAGILLLPLAVSLFYGESVRGFLTAIAISAAFSALCFLITRNKSIRMFSKEGFASVALSWIILSLIGAVPFVVEGEIPNYIDALFETISGFTTTYGSWASIFSAVALCCFAFSTIIGWGLYGSRFVEFLFRTSKAVRPFLVIYSFVAILGATVNLDLLWNIADTFNGLMSIPNLIALLLLSGTVVKLTKEFFAKEDERKLKK